MDLAFAPQSPDTRLPRREGVAPVRFVPIAHLREYLGRPIRFALLERRSKDDPDTKSLAVQHAALTKFLEGLPEGSWECDLRLAKDGGDVFRQIVSAWRGTGHHVLLKRITARLAEYDVVLVHRLDRFGRKALAAFIVLAEMHQTGVRVFSVAEGIDTADPKQAFTSGLMLLLAQKGSDETSERIRADKDLAKQRGGWRGGAPVYGYQVAMTPGPAGDLVPIRDANGYKTLEHAPDKVPHLLQAVARIVDEGWSIAAAVSRLNDDAILSPRVARRGPDGELRPVNWSTSGLKRILLNPALAGWDVIGSGPDRFTVLTVNGQPHRPHPPILTDDRWEALQRQIARPGRPRRARSEALLSGLVTCHALRQDGTLCGRPMYGPAAPIGARGAYSCRARSTHGVNDPRRCSGNGVSASGMEQLITLVARGIIDTPAWQLALADAQTAARTSANTGSRAIDDQLAELDNAMAGLRAELTTAKSQRRREQIRRDVDAIDAEMAVLEAHRPNRAAGVGQVAARPGMDLVWEQMDRAQQRVLLGELIENIEILPDDRGRDSRSRTFSPARVRVHLRHVGVLHITEDIERGDTAVTCPECGQEFRDNLGLGAHRRHKHGIAGATARSAVVTLTYPCPQSGCAKTSTSAGGMKRHATLAHGTNDALACPLGCPRMFRGINDLNSHTRQAHNQKQKYELVVCPTCAKACKNTQGLLIHQGRAHKQS